MGWFDKPMDYTTVGFANNLLDRTGGGGGGGSYGISNWGNIGWNPVLESYARRKYFNENPSDTHGSSKKRDQFGQSGLLQLYGDEDINRQNIFNQMAEAFGRTPTDSEYSKLLPIWRQDPGLGRSALQALKEQQANSPEELAKKVPEQYEAVSQLFQSHLGREATQAEKDHFGSLLASKQIDPYTMQSFLQATPEYTTKQDTTARTNLRNELSTADTNYLTGKVLPAIQSSFAGAGRSLESSGFASALANSAKDLNTEREKYLANVGYQDYANNRQNIYSQYGANRDVLLSNQNYSRGRGDTLSDYYTKRASDIQDYSLQKQTYDQYLKNYGKKSSPWGAVGSLAGMGLGALFAAPTGGLSMLGGAQLGGMLGGTAGEFGGYF